MNIKRGDMILLTSYERALGYYPNATKRFVGIVKEIEQNPDGEPVIKTFFNNKWNWVHIEDIIEVISEA
tara:strand:+ start:300 stop:506 length:207 start_codon:yes stop_codon:yes gene_type:complete